MRQPRYEATPGTPWLNEAEGDKTAASTRDAAVGRTSGRMPDDQIAVAMLHLSAELIREHHPAVAAMIQYAIDEIVESSRPA